MNIKTTISCCFSAFLTIFSISASAIEIKSVQKKLDQFKEVNSCIKESRESRFSSVFLYFEGDSKDVLNIDSAVLKTDFSEFEIGFDHKKEEYFYRNIFGKEKHYEQIHRVCNDGSCKFNMIVYPKISFPNGHDNTDMKMTFYDKDNNRISYVKQNIGRFDSNEFKNELIPFDAYIEDGVIVVRKLPSDHHYEHYVTGLHIGLDGKKQEIDFVINKNQAEEGVIIGYPSYSDVNYIGVYFEKSQFGEDAENSIVENKIELYDSEKSFFDNCNPI